MRLLAYIPVIHVFAAVVVVASRSDCGCQKRRRLKFNPLLRLNLAEKHCNGSFARTCCVSAYSEVVERAGHYPMRGKMVFIEGGGFIMGSTDHQLSRIDGEHPERQVFVNDFYMDETEVTNAAFNAFMEETSHVTAAEKSGISAVIPLQISREVNESKAYQETPVPWFYWVPGANWMAPHGPGSTWEDKEDHPVVQMAWADAYEYCSWAGKRLPTEAEWEYACRAGRIKKKFPWGDNLKPDGVTHRMNTWQGAFPTKNSAKDGHKWTAPVRSYPSNDFGLYEMTGNAWEWVEDWWTTSHRLDAPHNPRGPDSSPYNLKTKKGGSYLCHKAHGFRSRCAGRHMNMADRTSSTIGFRCVKSAPPQVSDNDKLSWRPEYYDES